MGLLNFFFNIVLFFFVSHLAIEIFFIGGDCFPLGDRGEVDLNTDIEEDLYRIGGSLSVFDSADGFFFKPNVFKH